MSSWGDSVSVNDLMTKDDCIMKRLLYLVTQKIVVRVFFKHEIVVSTDYLSYKHLLLFL